MDCRVQVPESLDFRCRQLVASVEPGKEDRSVEVLNLKIAIECYASNKDGNHYGWFK
ncbi:MAG: hypothetical protein KDD61_07945 [Bdellovibrionales bacterium]|nr:hypothetical protein [Bdellovibrionales bacterium]